MAHNFHQDLPEHVPVLDLPLFKKYLKRCKFQPCKNQTEYNDKHVYSHS